jgi:hypothetical protein
MSERNGDRARFHKDRKRKLHHRQRIQALMAALSKRADGEASTRVASLTMHDEGESLPSLLVLNSVGGRELSVGSRSYLRASSSGE